MHAPSNSPEGGEPTNGDSSLSGRSGGAILFAACDCTGHGVPGAMVSVVCHNALNRAVREFRFTKPSDILNKTAELVIDNFSKSEDDIKDGMDISLCSLTPSLTKGEGAYTLQWAGANNPLWIVKKIDSNDNYPLSTINYQLIETKADKQPIGKYEDNHPFTNHTFELNKGDSIYIFSDGFADQFGGELSKKLTKKRFKDLILSIQNLSMEEQGKALENFIIDYRKDIEQIDDILVMGVKI
jgi:serine phosphatase RsbU (regulator of sigma subunit)